MSVGKLTSGKYKARYRDAAGKEHAQTFALKKRADEWERQQRAALSRGDHIDPTAGRMLFKDYAEAWRKMQQHGERSAAKCESDLRIHAYPTFGSRRLGTIRPSEVTAWYGGLELAAVSKRNVYAWLVSIFRAAVQDRLIAASPCQVRQRKEKRPPLEALTKEQVVALVAAVPIHMRGLFAFTAGSGLRLGEACGVTLDRFDALGREVKVDRQCVRTIKGHPVFDKPKSQAGYRTVPLASVVVNEVAAHLERHGTGKGGVLFSSSLHGALTSNQVSRAMKLAIASIIEDGGTFPAWATFHDLRHFYASLLIGRGCNVKQVQTVLGHESAVMTLDLYGHWWPDEDDSLRDAVQSVLGDDDEGEIDESDEASFG